MKLKNRKTGEIVELEGTFHRKERPDFVLESYDSLAGFCEEWEDVPEEPKKWMK